MTIKLTQITQWKKCEEQFVTTTDNITVVYITTCVEPTRRLLTVGTGVTGCVAGPIPS